MWKCPVCEKTSDGMLCKECGFDGSRDYEHHPTLGKLTDKAIAISRLRAERVDVTMESPDHPVETEIKSEKKQIWPVLLSIAMAAVLVCVFWGVLTRTGRGNDNAGPSGNGPEQLSDNPYVEYTQNEKGQIIKTVYKDLEGNVVVWYESEYDDQGREVVQTGYLANRAVLFTATYKYADMSVAVYCTHYENGEATALTEIEYELNQAGNCCKEVKVVSYLQYENLTDGSCTEYTYDRNQNVTQMVSYDSENKDSEFVSSYEYDGQNRMIREKSYTLVRGFVTDAFDAYVGYDDNGRRSVVSIYSVGAQNQGGVESELLWTKQYQYLGDFGAQIAVAYPDGREERIYETYNDDASVLTQRIYGDNGMYSHTVICVYSGPAALSFTIT